MPNLSIYRFYAPVYDIIFAPILRNARQRAIEHLELEPGETLLIPGVGTGLDLPFLPDGVRVAAVDLCRDMLRGSCEKTAPEVTVFSQMDAQNLAFPDLYFDAVILNLALSVVPDARRVFQEAWRVLKMDGRMVIFDKFLPVNTRLSGIRKMIGCLISRLGTDPNRSLEEMYEGVSMVVLDLDEPSLLRGQYRIIRMRKKMITFIPCNSPYSMSI